MLHIFCIYLHLPPPQLLSGQPAMSQSWCLYTFLTATLLPSFANGVFMSSLTVLATARLFWDLSEVISGAHLLLVSYRTQWIKPDTFIYTVYPMSYGLLGAGAGVNKIGLEDTWRSALICHTCTKSFFSEHVFSSATT